MRGTWSLLLAPVLLAACGSDPQTTTTDADATQPPASAWTDVVDAGAEALGIADADWLQVVGDSVYTTIGGPAGSSVQGIDAATGKAGAAIPTEADTCTAMAVGYGSLWAAVCSGPSSALLRIDPATGRVLATVKIKDAAIQWEGSVASAEGSVWVVTASPHHALVRIDPASNTVVGETSLPVDVVAVRAGLGSLWATDPTKGRLLRLDPRTGEAVATTAVGAGARFFAVGEGAVWVQNNGDGTVSRVDPATNTVVATIDVDTGPIEGGDLAVGGGRVWARVSSWLVSEIDPATNTVVARYGPPAGSGSVAADDTALWISAHDQDVVYRLPLE